MNQEALQKIDELDIKVLAAANMVDTIKGMLGEETREKASGTLQELSRHLKDACGEVVALKGKILEAP